MALLLADVSDQYLREMAAYFSALKQPYPPPERMVSTPDETKLARRLINQGDPTRDIPACIECHGKTANGYGTVYSWLTGPASCLHDCSVRRLEKRRIDTRRDA